jgi:hypothetical protein
MDKPRNQAVSVVNVVEVIILIVVNVVTTGVLLSWGN